MSTYMNKCIEVGKNNNQERKRYSCKNPPPLKNAIKEKERW